MAYLNTDIETEALKALDVLKREREMSLSVREWKHRVTGYGYKIRDTDLGAVVTKLPQNIVLCVVPERLCA